MLAFALNMQSAATAALAIGLILFGLIFAMNSAVHSFLIVSYADADGISLDVGFYYMANAAGRLLGTICSGWVYQAYGISACLAVSSLFLIAVTAISAQLPKRA
jgi:predicted MFS family arabinose efflux permease